MEISPEEKLCKPEGAISEVQDQNDYLEQYLLPLTLNFMKVYSGFNGPMAQNSYKNEGTDTATRMKQMSQSLIAVFFLGGGCCTEAIYSGALSSQVTPGRAYGFIQNAGDQTQVDIVQDKCPSVVLSL